MIRLSRFHRAALPYVFAGFTVVTLALAAPSPASAQASADPWWKHALVDELYPRSFQDSNGDGVGDLNGITQRLDYLQKLGVDAIWIAPMYPSPQVDFGYDISDYENVDPQYGSLADMQRLIDDAQKHHIHVLLDMVLNHTSDKHKWFIESAASRTNPKQDWYVWSDGIKADSPGVTAYQKRYEHEGMVPPNNWTSLFGGSAWEWVPARKQFYYHKFYKQQPDLNWRNPAVEKACFGAMKFWLDRGVAGFRLDAIPTLFEDPQLRNEPELGGTNAQGDPNLNDMYTNMLPEVHDVQRRMRKLVDSYPGNRVLIGETYLPDTQELMKWYGASQDELQLPMDMLVGFHTEGGGPSSPNVKLDINHFRKYLTEMETQLGPNWPLLVFDNHDNERSWNRFGDGVHNAAIAKIIATTLLTTRATALMYYGEELGMTTETPTRKEDVKDPIGITGWPKEKGRDGERTPMQWTPGPQAGFSTNPHTWLPLAPNYKTVNVEVESKEPNSQLTWFEKLSMLRRENASLHAGSETMLDSGNEHVLSWVRSAPGSKSVVLAMNFSAEPQTVTLDVSKAGAMGSGARTLATDDSKLEGTHSLKSITLAPFASYVAEIE
ncbi:alpha-glucosidase [Bryocella elongata]|uniref:Alpha-glucosidase n=1 Tax=Bryocella elongata TaxID=863522 RepID=A0A1H5U6W2_9BACT|nr:alpha-glucosidase [Bryocella elongata]SEF70750.1 alpha-glucosidase [Bryocella elongata]